MFDRNRTAAPSTTMNGISNVSIVLQNTATNAALAVLTNTNGEYVFQNVPNGNYQIVEAYGFTPAIPTPGDFSNAAVGAALDGGTTPPISFATSPPVGATHLDCTIPNTLLVTVDNLDLTEQNFLNGPVTYTPVSVIMDDSVIVSPNNLIVNASEGTFGRFPAGQEANTGADPNPYPDLGADFIYVLPAPGTVKPADGEYTIQNIMNRFISGYTTWWVIADHTFGNEIGRMMVVNGDNPGASIIKEVVSVNPNTYYLFSAWIMNLIKRTSSYYALPALGVAILDENGQELYRETLGNLIPGRETCPEWKQIGTALYTGENTSLTVQFTSMGPKAIGNDYVIDDITLNEIEIQVFKPSKSVNTPSANVGETVTFTVTLEKPGREPLTNIIFQDSIPNGMSFVPNSVTVNGTPLYGVNPNDGFAVSDILGGSTLTVSFSAKIDFLPDPNPTVNKANITYSYSPVEGGISGVYEVETNEVYISVSECADLAMEKISQLPSVRPSEKIIYTLSVKNLGPSGAENVVISDVIPAELYDPQYSLDNGTTWQPWTGTLSVGTIACDDTVSILVEATVRQTAYGSTTNTATVTSATYDPNLDNNTSTVTTVIITPMQDLWADLEITKTASPNPCTAGEEMTYTLTVTNLGPDEAIEPTLMDAVGTNILNPQFSVDGLTWDEWTGSHTLPTLARDESATVMIKGTVNPDATGFVANTAVTISTTPDPDHENNTSYIETPLVRTPSCDLSIQKTACPCVATPCKPLYYKITITNAGPDTAEGVLLIDNMPSMLCNHKYSQDFGETWKNWTGTLPIGEVAAHSTVTIFLKGIVDGCAMCQIKNTAVVTTRTKNTSTNTKDSVITKVERDCCC